MRSQRIVAFGLIALLWACGDDGASSGGGEGGSPGAGGGGSAATGGDAGEGGQVLGGGGSGAGASVCPSTACDDKTPLDAATAFGVIEGVYQGHANATCDDVAPGLVGQFVQFSEYTIQVDSGGTIWVTGETATLGWSFLSPGDCDFACQDGSGTTWVAYQDDVQGATSRITFARNGDGSPEVLILHGETKDCVFYPLTQI